MSEAIYLLCALTSLTCAVLLFRGYLHSRVSLLLWSGLCFAGLMVENVMLFVDLVVVPDVNLFPWRNLAALVGLTLLLYGLIVESR